ncbi:hypothetical protein B0T17DRAFT_511320 [Bombardia bombarda]|uniref:BHLH domain-containing protein n=1 Tax=Bombardia bombarda TaxID=252184 RepID=A0AA39WBR9_9PEZI|nr:hypothetical protein B0T17DRAFT_511320 [Bombardia bombarda]
MATTGSSDPLDPDLDPNAARQQSPEERTRLTEAEKKKNHIASEQKRRQAIREGFDLLSALVPGLEGQGRSEALVLRRTVELMLKAIEERRRLINEMRALGVEVPAQYWM